jgi:hypothetical protein
MQEDAVKWIVFEYKGVRYKTGIRFYEDRLDIVVLPDGTLLKYTGDNFQRFMLTVCTPCELMSDFKEIGSISLEEVTCVSNAIMAIEVEKPY